MICKTICFSWARCKLFRNMNWYSKQLPTISQFTFFSYLLLSFFNFSSDKEQKDPCSAWCEKHCPGWRSSNPFSHIRNYVSLHLIQFWNCTLLRALLHTNKEKWRFKSLHLFFTAMRTWCPMIWPEQPCSKLFLTCVFINCLLTSFIWVQSYFYITYSTLFWICESKDKRAKSEPAKFKKRICWYCLAAPKST